jgi:hypothetical protein
MATGASTVEKLSISVPREVWAAARRTLAADKNETNSAFITRVLRVALERAKEDQYALGYQQYPPAKEEDALSRAAFGANAAALRAEEAAAGLPVLGGDAAYAAWKAQRAAR